MFLMETFYFQRYMTGRNRKERKCDKRGWEQSEKPLFFESGAVWWKPSD